MEHTEGLVARLAELACKVEKHPDEDAVHHLRTTIRRLETLLANDTSSPAKLAKMLKRVRRRAGTLRDLDVQLDKAKRFTAVPAQRAQADVVVRYLTRKRGKGTDSLQRTVANELARKRFKQLEKWSAHAQHDEHGPEWAVEQALRKFEEATRLQWPLTEDNLHAYRIDCKRARYTAELGGEDKVAVALTSELKRIQDAIGEWHDWVALTETAKAALKSNTGALLGAMARERRRSFAEALDVVQQVQDRIRAFRSHPEDAAATEAA